MEMNIETLQMLNTLSATNRNNLSGVSGAIGGVIGASVGGPVGAVVGSTIGSIAGNVLQSVLPSYNIMQGSNGMNFFKVNRAPFGIMTSVIGDDEAKQISDYYCYYGCKTSRQEVLNLDNYMYQGHAYVQGQLNLQSNTNIPINYQTEIARMFKKGLHIIE